VSDDERPPVPGGEEGRPRSGDEPASGRDERPRPEYGEYATPEEQRARMGLPPAHHGALHAHTAASPAASAPSLAGHDGVAGREPAPPRAQPSGSETRPARGWDRLLTWTLLAIGLLTLTASAGSYLNMAPAMQAAYQELGIGHFGAGAIARPAGIALIIVQTAVWVGTALLSQRSLRRGRISFWIPLLGAVMSYISLVVVLLIVVLNDPAFVAYISASGRTAP